MLPDTNVNSPSELFVSKQFTKRIIRLKTTCWSWALFLCSKPWHLTRLTSNICQICPYKCSIIYNPSHNKDMSLSILSIHCIYNIVYTSSLSIHCLSLYMECILGKLFQVHKFCSQKIALQFSSASISHRYIMTCFSRDRTIRPRTIRPRTILAEYSFSHLIGKCKWTVIYIYMYFTSHLFSFHPLHFSTIIMCSSLKLG